MIKGINKNEFSNYNFIYIDNINLGLKQYNHMCVTGEYEKIYLFLKKLIDKSEIAYFDFYYPNLKESEKQLFKNNDKYAKIIEKFNIVKDDIYFNIEQIDDEILNFLIDISYREILFSTFYFKNPDITIWTNYNKQLVIFYNNSTDISEYIEIIKKLNLKVLFNG